jgi:hypothetical protein
MISDATSGHLALTIFQVTSCNYTTVVENVTFIYLLIYFMVEQPLIGQGLLIIQASRSHSGTSQSIGLLWISHQSDADSSL